MLKKNCKKKRLREMNIWQQKKLSHK
ncbi:hypothetical protein A2U01_0075310, partial [Trifolium medium]|nr:hypothetical protein [Trifolium medium]